MKASDFRALAREALRGKWLKTALILLLGMLLGGGACLNLPDVNFNFRGSAPAASSQSMAASGQGASETFVNLIEQDPRVLMLFLALLCVFLFALLYIIFLGSWVRIGMLQLGCKVMDGEEPRVSMLFPKGIYWKAVGLNLLKGLYVFLWSLLFIFPGIIASYRYAMADYILYNNPEIGVNEALRRSKARMHGRKWRLFCLQFSFIGWELLYTLGFTLLLSMVNVLIQSPVVALQVLFPVSMLVAALLTAYTHMSGIAFFRAADRSANWFSEAREGEAYAEENHGFMEDVRENASAASAAVPHYAQPAPPQSALSADETVARDVFMQHKCSRRRMMEEGVLEEYKAMQVSPIAEVRWIREYGDTLMLRFDRDANALDEILNLCAEYALDELANRALMRIERHIRRESLPDGEILNMCGRVLAMVTSGVFDENEAFIDRKKEQISDMADRLEHRLNENAPEGEWKNALQLLRGML